MWERIYEVISDSNDNKLIDFIIVLIFIFSPSFLLNFRLTDSEYEEWINEESSYSKCCCKEL